MTDSLCRKATKLRGDEGAPIPTRRPSTRRPAWTRAWGDPTDLEARSWWGPRVFLFPPAGTIRPGYGSRLTQALIPLPQNYRTGYPPRKGHRASVVVIISGSGATLAAFLQRA